MISSAFKTIITIDPCCGSSLLAPPPILHLKRSSPLILRPLLAYPTLSTTLCFLTIHPPSFFSFLPTSPLHQFLFIHALSSFTHFHSFKCRKQFIPLFKVTPVETTTSHSQSKDFSRFVTKHKVVFLGKLPFLTNPPAFIRKSPRSVISSQPIIKSDHQYLTPECVSQL